MTDGFIQMPTRSITIYVARILTLFLVVLTVEAAAQNEPHRLSKEDVVKLLKGQVSPHRVSQRARQQGIDFQVTPQVEQELRQAGATDELIATLREIAPAPRPAQIEIQTSPRAQIYLDDVFKGQASSEGRLIVENPKPGDHELRVTLTDKKDYLQRVSVVAGQTANVKATLSDLAGRIAVQTSTGAEVFLDNSSRGAVGTTGELLLQDVSPGSHQLEVRAQGKREFRQNVTVLAGRETKTEARLESIGPAAGTVRANPQDGLKYVWIPPGTFMMGCSRGDNRCADDEKPAHQVTITHGFWIGQTPVTVGAYKRFVGAAGRKYRFPAPIKLGRADENGPIVKASWDDSQAYCGWISGRLPTEAMWEYAARAGSAGALYDDLYEIAWYAQNSGYQIHVVAQRRANGLGLYEMLGDVSEWVNDWYDERYYQSSPSRDPEGPTGGLLRVLRGASWYTSAADVRVSLRGKVLPVTASGTVGFRCVWQVEDP